MRRFRYTTSCIDAAPEATADMILTAKEVTREAFLHYVYVPDVSFREKVLGYAANPNDGMLMRDDYHVRYYRSTYRREPCVFFTHSAIEYIFAMPVKAS